MSERHIDIDIAVTSSLTGIITSSLSSTSHLMQIRLTSSTPTTQFPKLTIPKVVPNAANSLSNQDSGMLICLSGNRIDSDFRGQEDGTSTSLRSLARNDWELWGVGVELRVVRESRERWRRLGRRGWGVDKGREDSYWWASQDGREIW